MKTIKTINEEISDIKNQIESGEITDAVEKRLRKKIPFLKMCIMYLESNPAPEFILSELEKVHEKIVRRMDLFILKDEEKLTKKDVTKLRAAHERLHDVKHLRDQSKALRYLST